MRTCLLFLLTALISLSVYAQTPGERQCGAEILKKHLAEKMPDASARLLQTLNDNVANADAANNAAMKTTATASPIPVVFHIVLTAAQVTQLGGTAGIEKRIDSQIAVINRDFNKQNSDSTKIPAGFKPLYANANIRFGLAHRKPDGSATPGYEIITTTATGIEESSAIGSGMGFAGAKFINGSPTAWDPTTYLNIWVVNPLQSGSASSILGLTTPPSFRNYGISGFTDNEIGIVLNYGAFGTRGTGINYFISGITGGRTLTHELGHFFEIWHVWGDDNGQCPGSGGNDDGISDTPPQANATYGAPTGIKFDGCTTAGNGIMYMNYMDYVDDAAMHMFTTKQAAVMYSQTTSGRESYSLTQHPEVLEWPTAVSSIDNSSTVDVYPNPTTGLVYINAPGGVNSIQVYDITGKLEQNIVTNKTLQSYNIDLSSSAKGMHIVHCSTDNGTTVKKIMVQ